MAQMPESRGGAGKCKPKYLKAHIKIIKCTWNPAQKISDTEPEIANLIFDFFTEMCSYS